MEDFTAYHNVSADIHQQRFDEFLAQGMRMTWVNVSGSTRRRPLRRHLGSKRRPRVGRFAQSRRR